MSITDELTTTVTDTFRDVSTTVTDTVKSVQDSVKNVQNWSLEAIKATDDAVVDAAKTIRQRLEPVTERVPSAPANLPEPKEVIDSWFTFAESLLAQQKKFSLELASTVTGQPVRKPAARKTASKARAQA